MSRLDDSQRQPDPRVVENLRIAKHLSWYPASHLTSSGRENRVTFETIPYAAQVYPAPSNPAESQALFVPSRPVTPQLSESSSFDKFLDAYNRYLQLCLEPPLSIQLQQ